MALELTPKTTLDLRPLMTLQLQQAIKLLQLSRMELTQKIQQELEKNPALETADELTEKDNFEELRELSKYLDSYDSRWRNIIESEVREFPNLENYTTYTESLADHLLNQLLMTSPTTAEERIGSFIAGSLDKNGYLKATIEQIADMSNSETKRVQSVLSLMQTFAPPRCVRQRPQGMSSHSTAKSRNRKCAGSVYYRQITIYRVMESILKFQYDFFEKGIAHLKPMVLRDVANDIGLAESTISRINAKKYVQTPRGIFSLKYFFSSSVNGVNGEPIAATAVQDQIKHIIENENPKKPLSDDQIAIILKDSNIKIARRTVAKYREKLGIPSSTKRKPF